MLKKIVVSTFFVISFLFFFSFEQTFAIQNIPDGNATWDNGYRPSQYDSGARTHARDVPSNIRTAWERNQIKRGRKHPDIVYHPRNENLFMYDVYSKHLSNNGRGWEIYTSGQEDFFSFDGWSINAGYHHHTRGNQATYIGVENTRTKERKIYKAMMLENLRSTSAYTAINPDTGKLFRRCRDNEYRVEIEEYVRYKDNGETVICNMDYHAVGFRAFIPLNDLFPNLKSTDEWVFYIIKNVEGVLVYDEIVLPFNEPAIEWENGELTLRSQLNNDHLVAIDDITIKYKSPTGNFSPSLGTFNKGKTYRRTGQDERNTEVWYRVFDNVAPNATNEQRWANSARWQFGGSIATLSYKPKYADVTIRHLDAKNNKLIKSETKRVLINQNHTFSPASRGTFKDKDGNPYVPVPLNQTVTTKITGDRTINFYYKASIPDPSYTIEDPKTTEGRAKGDMQWFLAKDKDDSPSKLVIQNNVEINGEHVDTRNAVHKIHIQYPDDNINDGILNRKEYSFPNPNILKNGKLILSFEYEYTNFQNVIFKCVDVQFNDCFEWQLDEIKPSWSKEHTEKAEWKATLPVDHQYGETISVLNMYEENKKSLRVGRKATVNGNENKKIEQTEMFETFKNNTPMEHLITQTFFVVDQDIQYESDMKNKLYFLEEKMNFYPYKEFLDNNLRDKYKVENPNPNLSYGDYELPMRVDKKTNSNIHFKLADVFYVTKRTGFQFSLPYEERSTTVINKTAKEEYEAFTNETYEDEVLTKHNNSSILFMNIDGKADLKPKTFYQSKYELGKLGLSDVYIDAYVFHSFNQYLIGSPFDNPVVAEVQTSVVEDVTYTHSVTISPKQMKEIRKLSEDRGMLLHSYRTTDHYRIYNELKKILPSFDE